MFYGYLSLFLKIFNYFKSVIKIYKLGFMKIGMARRRKMRVSRRAVNRPKSTGRPTQAVAIAALILNLVLPGLGTIVGGRTGEGITQLVLALVSVPLMVVIIGFPLMIGIWIWALVSSIQLIKAAE